MPPDLPSSAPPLFATSADKTPIAIHDLGGSGSPLLLCHATGFHGRVWAPVAATLRERAHSYAPDLRGHGDSPVDADAPMDWWDFAQDVLATVDSLRLQEVRAAGHSKGATALLLAELLRPGTFVGLYLFEPIVFPGSVLPVDVAAKNPLAASARRRRSTFDSFETAIANFAAKPPMNELCPEALDAYVRHGFRTGPDGQVHLKCQPEVEARVYEMGTQHGAFARLGEVTCPVTVARGTSSTFGPAAIAPAIADALPLGRLEEHPDLGHFGPLQDPATIANCIAQCLGLAT